MQRMNIVIIDGDGARFGNKYYRQRDAIGAGVRGDRARDGIMAKDATVIVSEGIVLTKSESLAKQIVMLTQKRIEEIKAENPEKNPTVRRGKIALLEEIVFEDWDIEINNALVERLSQVVQFLSDDRRTVEWDGHLRDHGVWRIGPPGPVNTRDGASP